MQVTDSTSVTLGNSSSLSLRGLLLHFDSVGPHGMETVCSSPSVVRMQRPSLEDLRHGTERPCLSSWCFAQKASAQDPLTPMGSGPSALPSETNAGIGFIVARRAASPGSSAN